jgi:hypothetical protein
VEGFNIGAPQNEKINTEDAKKLQEIPSILARVLSHMVKYSTPMRNPEEHDPIKKIRYDAL